MDSASTGSALTRMRHLDQIAFVIALDVIVEAGITAANRFQPIIEIKHHFVQRQAIDHHGAGAGIGQLDLAAAAVLAQFQHRAQMFVGNEDRRADPRLLDFVDLGHLGHVGRIVHLDHRAVGHVNAIDHRRRGGDQIEIEFPLQPLADDLQMQKTEEAAAKAEPERRRGLGFIGEARIVEMQPRQRVAQIFEAAPHRRGTSRRTQPAGPV